ncbi:hypothetical protein D7319_29525 [Streptomyces radicis]|uniref:Hen1 N-terminal domain-containing protein n=1 Tax=Streptomyces radicis TaxID=1750517 RepID=A0A3A9VT57_9ACTN|nr:hypothetical protein D7319_29525 [Streptomyces radicis]RKN14451.1 hypothetical protein D7318_29450 [Streptomyces radicis]
MFLTISAAGDAARPATDLGFLLHKHPDRAQEFSTAAGAAQGFYPVAEVERCTAAPLLDVDPVALIRNRGPARGAAPDATLAQYVNDRPCAASSLLAVALGQVLRTAMRSRCAARPELPGHALPLTVEVPALPARGGAEVVRRLFEPLGWTVEADSVPGAFARAVRRADGRDRRVRAAGALPLGGGLPGRGGRGVRPHPGAARLLAEQHPVPGHRLCLRRGADRAAPARAGDRRHPGGAGAVRAGQAAGHRSAGRHGRPPARPGDAAAALEVMSRFAVDPWLRWCAGTAGQRPSCSGRRRGCGAGCPPPR